MPQRDARDKMTDREKYDRYISNLSLLNSDQKYWLHRILFYEKTRHSTGLKSILCDFSKKSLKFQSKHLDLPYEEFATAPGPDYNLWPAIEKEGKKLSQYLHTIEALCENDKKVIPDNDKKATIQFVKYVTGKLWDAMEYLKLRHPDDLAGVQHELAPHVLRCEPLLEEDCKTQ